jgi:hypothetical protein
MNTPTAHHQIGKFIVMFQDLEAAINEILILLVNVDNESVLILINELEYQQRLNTADVLFGRFVDLNGESKLQIKAEFHKLICKLKGLGERRNVLVHSKYMPWINIEGLAGLIRKNSKFRKGIREQEEEELLPETFTDDFHELATALEEIESFRLNVIDGLYPEAQD